MLCNQLPLCFFLGALLTLYPDIAKALGWIYLVILVCRISNR